MWLEDLQRAKAEALRGDRNKVTISDVIERANDPRSGSLEPTSPRSVEACLRLGVEPSELRHVPMEWFLHVEHGDHELADIAYKHCETIRTERLAALVEERKHVIEEEEHGGGKKDAAGAHPGGKAAHLENADMVEKEAKRLEVMKRRQEREMQQMVAYEVMRKELQDKAKAKLRVLEERAEEQRRQKAAADEEWRRQQRERELQRAKDDEEREAEIKTIEAARYTREMEQARREAAEEKLRRKQAYLKEQERIQKSEQARRETERILWEQQQEVDRKKAEMQRRDVEREKIKQKQQEEAALKNAEARAKAEARITSALEQNKQILIKKREDFDAKQAHNEERRKQREAERIREEHLQREREAAKQEQRKLAYLQAQEREALRVSEILRKTQEKDVKLMTLKEARDHDNACRNLEKKLDLDLKREKVEAMKRRDMYQRNQLLHKIQSETEKAHDLLEQRTSLQQQRKMANMTASFQRQKLLQSMEKLQSSKNWSALASGGGQVNLDQMLRSK